MKTSLSPIFPKLRSVKCKIAIAALALIYTFSGDIRAESEKGFVSLFDGQSLNGWKYIGNKGGEYFVKDGVIVCPESSKGNLLTDGEYSDFVLRLEYKLDHNGNNGVAIRAPMSAEN